ncbi:MAG: hypothetical protein LBF92_03655 [Synergistaceae bacterium]|nr:hypothetical protein [Synergistaceae bacterium]
MGQQELITTVRNLKGFMNMREELEAEIAAAQDQVKAEMTAREVDTMTADGSRNTNQSLLTPYSFAPPAIWS